MTDTRKELLALARGLESSQYTGDTVCLDIDTVDNIVAKLRAIAEREAWRPIASAPKDGTKILVFALDGGQSVAHWSESEGGTWNEDEGRNTGGGQWIDGTVGSWGMEEFYWLKPTHWRPLPAPPNTSK